jgi:hypothetical protein
MSDSDLDMIPETPEGSLVLNDKRASAGKSNGAAAGAPLEAVSVVPSAIPDEQSVIETMQTLLDLSKKVLDRKRVISDLNAKKVEDETHAATSQQDIDKHKSAIARLRAEVQKHEKDRAQVEAEARVKRTRLNETMKQLKTETEALVIEKDQFGKLTLEMQSKSNEIVRQVMD